MWNNVNEIQDQIISINFEEIEDLFSNQPVAATQKPSAGDFLSRQTGPQKPEEIHLITEQKRLYNINIMLSKFKKYTIRELAVQIRDLSPGVITADTAQTLLTHIPDYKEIKKFQQYDGGVEQLDKPSQYFYYISRIPRLQIRLKMCIFKEEFSNKVSSFDVSYEKIKSCCDILKNNASFQKFLKVVLDLGNKMNQGTNKGGVQGFKISSL